MNLRRVLLGVATVIGGWACASHAADMVVYVKESAWALPFTSQQGGFGGQDGSLANPFGTIQAAYRYLWTQSGNHEIRLIGDENNVFEGDEVGFSAFDQSYGQIAMTHSGFNPWPTGTPAWTSVTLMANDPVNNPVKIRFNKNQFDNNDTAGAEQELANRGTAGTYRGLWWPGTLVNLPGMIVEDLTIEISGGGFLIASTAQGSGPGASVWNFAFNRVELYLESDMLEPSFGRAALWAAEMGSADIAASSVDFNDANIYYDPVGLYPQNGLLAGGGWAFADMFRQPGFFDGNGTSRLYKWDTATRTKLGLHTNLQEGIWAGIHNLQNPPPGFASGGNYFQINQNGTWSIGGAAPQFIVNFTTVPYVPPPPSGMVLLVQ